MEVTTTTSTKEINVALVQDLFPPLPTTICGDLDDEIDASFLENESSPICTASAFKELSKAIDNALCQWNEIDPIVTTERGNESSTRNAIQHIMMHSTSSSSSQEESSNNETLQQISSVFKTTVPTLSGICKKRKYPGSIAPLLMSEKVLSKHELVYSTKQLDCSDGFWIDITPPSGYRHNSDPWLVEIQDLKTSTTYRVSRSSTLADFASVLSCNYSLLLENSTMNTANPPSHCFYIEKKFYKSPNTIVDYTKEIRDWILNSTEHQAVYGRQQQQPSNTDGTTWKDLMVKFNAKYVFIHHGNCEHVFTIQNVFKSSNTTSSFSRRAGGTKRRKKCGVCSMYLASRVCDNDYRIGPAMRNYYCEKCYYAAHYSKEGGKLMFSDFKSYPYFQIP